MTRLKITARIDVDALIGTLCFPLFERQAHARVLFVGPCRGDAFGAATFGSEFSPQGLWLERFSGRNGSPHFSLAKVHVNTIGWLTHFGEGYLKFSVLPWTDILSWPSCCSSQAHKFFPCRFFEMESAFQTLLLRVVHVVSKLF